MSFHVGHHHHGFGAFGAAIAEAKALQNGNGPGANQNPSDQPTAVTPAGQASLGPALVVVDRDNDGLIDSASLAPTLVTSQAPGNGATGGQVSTTGATVAAHDLDGDGLVDSVSLGHAQAHGITPGASSIPASVDPSTNATGVSTAGTWLGVTVQHQVGYVDTLAQLTASEQPRGREQTYVDRYYSAVMDTTTGSPRLVFGDSPRAVLAQIFGDAVANADDTIPSR